MNDQLDDYIRVAKTLYPEITAQENTHKPEYEKRYCFGGSLNGKLYPIRSNARTFTKFVTEKNLSINPSCAPYVREEYALAKVMYKNKKIIDIMVLNQYLDCKELYALFEKRGFRLLE